MIKLIIVAVTVIIVATMHSFCGMSSRDDRRIEEGNVTQENGMMINRANAH